MNHLINTQIINTENNKNAKLLCAFYLSGIKIT